MQIYHYHPEEKFYLTESTARPDPKEKDRFLVPLFATPKKPPVCKKFECAIFDGGWKVVPYRVGQYYYRPDGVKVTIDKVGVGIPTGCIQEDPPSIYHSSHNGVTWTENVDLKSEHASLQEISDLKNDLKAALVWQFRMIETLWDTGVSKGIWAASDIPDTELKQKYAQWKTKLSRLKELGE